MLNKDMEHDLIKEVKSNLIKSMQIRAEKLLNPNNYHLSSEAKKRLRWLYILYYEKQENVTQAANKAGISRPWLSKIKSIFEYNNRDPRSLEPSSRAPHDTSKRNRISKDLEARILKVRDRYGWGKEKISAFLKTEYGIRVHHNTVNKYLHLHKRIDPRISLRNIEAFKDKKQRESERPIFKVKFRPPAKIKDYLPGALVEKDMKYVLKIGRKGDSKEDFWYQHGAIDSFTRIKATELSENPDSQEASQAFEEMEKRIPFKIACFNTDNGSENEKEFSEKLQKENIFHFYSNTGRPTDNPRIERAFLSDDLEFYNRSGLCRNFQEQKEALREWDEIWNWKRPHQALGYLSPMRFYQLWKENPEEAYRIVEKWQDYLRRQRIRQAQSRKIKRKEQIEALMKFIDAKLNKNKGLNEAKLQLINCQLCSVA
jgi:transposase InsO family protein